MNDIAIPLINLSNHGGIRILIELANYLTDQGHSVTFYIPKGKKNTVYTISEKIKIIEINTIIKNKNISYAIFLSLIWIYLKKHNTIICNFFPTAYPSLISKTINKKQNVYYFVQGIESIYNENITGKILNNLCNKTYRFKFKLIAANKQIQKKLEETKKNNINNINIGISEKFFTQKIKEIKKFDVLYFLREEKWKQKEELEKIAKKILEKNVDIKIVCISQNKNLLEEYKNKGFYIERPRDDEELINIIDSCKTMVFTSKYEGFGLPPLECMSRGVPAVSYSCIGTDIYINDEKNSFIVHDSDNAAKKIIFLLKNEKEYKTMSIEAKKTALLYRNKTAFETFNNLIKIKDDILHNS